MGHGPTRGPRDAAEGEECGWVNDQLGNSSSHKDSASMCSVGRVCEKELVKGGNFVSQSLLMATLTSIDLEFPPRSYCYIICNGLDFTFEFGPVGNFLTGSRVSLFSENAEG